MGGSDYSYQKGTTMDRDDKMRFGASIGAGGDKDGGSFHVSVYRFSASGESEHVFHHDGNLSFDGDKYEAAEWILEALQEIVESF